MTPVFGIAGRSGSGKTTLIEAMLPLRARAGGQRDQAQPPRFRDGAARQDSARFRQAGAHEVMVASPYRYAIVHELRGGPELHRWRSSSNGWRRPTWCWWRASSRPPSRASRFTGRRWQAGAARGGRRLPGRGHGRGAGNDARCDAAMPAAERAGRGGGVHLPHTGAGAGESLGFPPGGPGPICNRPPKDYTGAMPARQARHS